MQERFPESIKPTIDLLLEDNSYPSRKIFKRIDRLMADSVAKAQVKESALLSNITLSPEIQIEHLLNNMNVRTNNKKPWSDKWTQGGTKTSTVIEPEKPVAKQEAPGSSGPKTYQPNPPKKPWLPREEFLANKKALEGKTGTGGPKYPDRTDFCWYHKTHGFKAKFCSDPCTFSKFAEEQNENRQTQPQTKQTTSNVFQPKPVNNVQVSPQLQSEIAKLVQQHLNQQGESTQ